MSCGMIPESVRPLICHVVVRALICHVLGLVPRTLNYVWLSFVEYHDVHAMLFFEPCCAMLLLVRLIILFIFHMLNSLSVIA
jgi:hypothetical protein